MKSVPTAGISTGKRLQGMTFDSHCILQRLPCCSYGRRPRIWRGRCRAAGNRCRTPSCADCAANLSTAKSGSKSCQKHLCTQALCRERVYRQTNTWPFSHTLSITGYLRACHSSWCARSRDAGVREVEATAPSIGVQPRHQLCGEIISLIAWSMRGGRHAPARHAAPGLRWEGRTQTAPQSA